MQETHRYTMIHVSVCSSTFLQIRCSLRPSLSHKLHFAHNAGQQSKSTVSYGVCFVLALILQDSVPFIFFNNILCLCAAMCSCWGELSISMSLNTVADICRLYIISTVYIQCIYIYIHSTIMCAHTNTIDSINHFFIE